MNRLEGKTAIITGAAQGMGAEHARRFVREGACVVLTDVNAAEGHKLADELGERAIFLPCDVCNSADWTEAVTAAERLFGRVAVLVNNAGILGPLAKTVELSEADYLKVCAVNQHSVYLGMKAVIPSMLKAGSGSIVNISSIAGIVAIHGCPNVAYAGSKFAVRGMSKAAAVEYGRCNIRVNSVHPGYILTPMTAAAFSEGTGDALASVPLGRLARAEEVTNLVLFLASDEASYVTGAEYVIDAGLTAQ